MKNSREALNGVLRTPEELIYGKFNELVSVMQFDPKTVCMRLVPKKGSGKSGNVVTIGYTIEIVDIATVATTGGTWEGKVGTNGAARTKEYESTPTQHSTATAMRRELHMMRWDRHSQPSTLEDGPSSPREKAKPYRARIDYLSELDNVLEVALSQKKTWIANAPKPSNPRPRGL